MTQWSEFLGESLDALAVVIVFLSAIALIAFMVFAFVTVVEARPFMGIAAAALALGWALHRITRGA